MPEIEQQGNRRYAWYGGQQYKWKTKGQIQPRFFSKGAAEECLYKLTKSCASFSRAKPFCGREIKSMVKVSARKESEDIDSTLSSDWMQELVNKINIAIGENNYHD